MDGACTSFWEVHTDTDTTREIVLELPGDAAHVLTFITLVKFRGGSAAWKHHYRRFALYTDDGAGVWRRVPDAPEHPFVGYRYKYANGETWSLPAGTRARKVKLRLLDGYGRVIRIPEIRIYARHGAFSPR